MRQNITLKKLEAKIKLSYLFYFEPEHNDNGEQDFSEKEESMFAVAAKKVREFYRFSKFEEYGRDIDQVIDSFCIAMRNKLKVDKIKVENIVANKCWYRMFPKYMIEE